MSVNQHDRWSYVKTQKNDDRDAEAIARSLSRTLRQRTTSYGNPSAERKRAARP